MLRKSSFLILAFFAAAAVLISGCSKGKARQEAGQETPEKSAAPGEPAPETVTEGPEEAAPDTTPPAVLSTSPAAGASGVEPAAAVTVTFSEPIDPESLNTATFTVAAAGVPLNGTITAEGAAAVWTGEAPFAVATACTVTLSTEIRDPAGNKFVSPFVFSFTTRDRKWGRAELLEKGDAGHALLAQVAVDQNGGAVAIWAQGDGTRDSIWSNRYQPGGGWRTPELIETDNAGTAVYPDLAMDTGGNAFAVWRQSDGILYNILANRYAAGAGWEGAVLVETNSGTADEPAIAVDPNGNAIAVWAQWDGSRDNVWANRYAAGSGWETAGLIETLSGSAERPAIAMDPNGNAIAVWSHWDGFRYNIAANRYTAGSGWGTAVLIETDNAGDAQTPDVALSSTGDAIAVWRQKTDTNGDGLVNNQDKFSIYANLYRPGAGWGTAGIIETDNLGDAEFPQAVFDPDGNALIVWRQSDGIRYNIQAARYEPASGWTAPVRIETEDLGNAGYPRIAVNGKGNAVVVWEQSDGVLTNIWANRYTAGAWGAAEKIETDDTGPGGRVDVDMNPPGEAFAVWEQNDGTRINVWANRLE